jgi:hypothetical protein
MPPLRIFQDLSLGTPFHKNHSKPRQGRKISSEIIKAGIAIGRAEQETAGIEQKQTKATKNGFITITMAAGLPSVGLAKAGQGRPRPTAGVGW